MSGEFVKEFIPKERGSLPRVLLLDFDRKTINKILEKSKFQIFEGKTGMIDGEQLFPRDSSEIEIIFLDMQNWNYKCVSNYGGGYTLSPQNIASIDTLKISSKTVREFFSQVMLKGGGIAVFLNDNKSFIKVLRDVFLRPDATNIIDIFGNDRYTTSLELSSYSEEDIYYKFFQRFIIDGDVKYAIDVMTVKERLTKKYFSDEDGKAYAIVSNDRFIISPKVRELDKASLFLLQDVFSFVCKEDIYPSLNRFQWLNDKFYIHPEVIEEKRKIDDLTHEYALKISKERKYLEELHESYSYLQEMLYKDDSDLFDEDNKLKNVINKVLEIDLGFKNVKDMDKERTVQGLALKEDLVIDNNIFIEVKGTEKGARHDWKAQLCEHVIEYCTTTNTDVRKIKQIIIFNHERRQDPRDRSEPFKNDPQFLRTCECNKIALVPVFEIFKLVKSIKNGEITQEMAKSKIIACDGLLKV